MRKNQIRGVLLHWWAAKSIRSKYFFLNEYAVAANITEWLFYKSINQSKRFINQSAISSICLSIDFIQIIEKLKV